jgi:hypothetical protein
MVVESFERTISSTIIFKFVTPLVFRGVFCFSLRSSKTFPKEKKEKKKALSEGLDKWMQAFRLKNFPIKRSK